MQPYKQNPIYGESPMTTIMMTDIVMNLPLEYVFTSFKTSLLTLVPKIFLPDLATNFNRSHSGKRGSLTFPSLVPPQIQAQLRFDLCMSINYEIYFRHSTCSQRSQIRISNAMDGETLTTRPPWTLWCINKCLKQGLLGNTVTGMLK